VGAGNAAVRSNATIAAATTPGRSKPFKDIASPRARGACTTPDLAARNHRDEARTSQIVERTDWHGSGARYIRQKQAIDAIFAFCA
jgi:hypothetical protein